MRASLLYLRPQARRPEVHLAWHRLGMVAGSARRDHCA